MENQILIEKTEKVPARQRRFVRSGIQGREQPVADRVWLKELLLHAVGHACGVAMASGVALVLTTTAITSAAKPQAPACPAPEFSYPRIWATKA